MIEVIFRPKVVNQLFRLIRVKHIPGIKEAKLMTELELKKLRYLA